MINGLFCAYYSQCAAKRFDGDHNFIKLDLPSAAIFLNSVSAKRFAVGVENEKRRIT